MLKSRDVWVMRCSSYKMVELWDVLVIKCLSYKMFEVCNDWATRCLSYEMVQCPDLHKMFDLCELLAMKCWVINYLSYNMLELQNVWIMGLLICDMLKLRSVGWITWHIREIVLILSLHLCRFFYANLIINIFVKILKSINVLSCFA